MTTASAAPAVSPFSASSSAGREVTDWTWESVYPAPAKLNLFLHVVGRRADGYHCLQTAFRFVGHGDGLRFTPRDDEQLRLVTPLPGVPPERDLTIRAARLLQAETGCRRGVDIAVDKRLPMGGGLGGGSSDAATTLLALNHLWQLGLSRQRLQEIGLALGADVPVFVFGENAFAEGVGEELRPLSLPPACYLVIESPVEVPTALVFSAPDLVRDTPPLAPAAWQPGEGHNDLEAVVVARFPAVAERLTWLSGFARARMTGSGACVFAEFADRAQAEVVWRQMPAHFSGWLADGLSRHPLHALVEG
ncbi:4-(cytidine 5'-diphospho)-2-C-methyl-D-erythritol kinase [Rhodocyclus tenuis]|uniref:4-diphosphocytidyl-2-C-methyl-D-erythritol kinase n=1 Tax=Rhodocyclus gracilis TaxID=2929842 RepID=A0ABX0WLU5_9RHOO|nr:4-(cytidine 5'-diphospho)-2-C-methyl-D-erythritol kinase [Rhodocyclus gracilis]MRD72349.1 4-(cytidine 5'-diphospho)-2-C-methyl-D-erythritol kinase [Rhodocyclus gracilis]NJA89565.1 4-(cytidine 5'-diphospho)-2-C-methyl-D-erythritol kinase [Rhodocyclus gracilis]